MKTKLKRCSSRPATTLPQSRHRPDNHRASLQLACSSMGVSGQRGLFLSAAVALLLCVTATSLAVPIEIVVGASSGSASPANRGSTWEEAWQAVTAAGDGLGLQSGLVSFENGRHDSDWRWRVIRPLMVFEIPGLPSDAVIQSVSLYLRIAAVAIAQDDDQSYVRAVAADPQNPLSLALSDFGRISPTVTDPQFYSDAYYLHDFVPGQAVQIPLGPLSFGEILDGGAFTIALLGGHELENEDHFLAPNIHNQGFHTDSPGSATGPALRIIYEANATPPSVPEADTTAGLLDLSALALAGWSWREKRGIKPT